MEAEKMKRELLVKTAYNEGVSLTALALLCEDLEFQAVNKLCGNVSALPMKIKSKLIP